jgi:hypothetical protein
MTVPYEQRSRVVSLLFIISFVVVIIYALAPQTIVRSVQTMQHQAEVDMSALVLRSVDDSVSIAFAEGRVQDKTPVNVPLTLDTAKKLGLTFDSLPIDYASKRPLLLRGTVGDLTVIAPGPYSRDAVSPFSLTHLGPTACATCDQRELRLHNGTIVDAPSRNARPALPLRADLQYGTLMVLGLGIAGGLLLTFVTANARRASLFGIQTAALSAITAAGALVVYSPTPLAALTALGIVWAVPITYTLRPTR